MGIVPMVAIPAGSSLSSIIPLGILLLSEQNIKASEGADNWSLRGSWSQKGVPRKGGNCIFTYYYYFSWDSHVTFEPNTLILRGSVGISENRANPKNKQNQGLFAHCTSSRCFMGSISNWPRLEDLPMIALQQFIGFLDRNVARGPIAAIVY